MLKKLGQFVVFMLIVYVVACASMQQVACSDLCDVIHRYGYASIFDANGCTCFGRK